jgi:hypothetical protein
MPENNARLDLTRWSGEGQFTQSLIEHLGALDTITFIRVEDAPATRSDADYNFISNEIYVSFATVAEEQRVRRFGLFSVRRTVERHAMTISDLERTLASTSGIGAPDYSDETMLQYLHTERIIPPYQTRGYKLVELVRVYEFKPAAGAD